MTHIYVIDVIDATVTTNINIMNDNHDSASMVDPNYVPNDCIMYTMTRSTEDVVITDPGFPAKPKSPPHVPLGMIAVKKSGADERQAPSINGEYSESHLVAVQCSSKKAFMCEARVQTVTYYTWWYSNWVDFLLWTLLAVLFVALCVTICALCSAPSSSSRRRRQQQQQAAQRAHMANHARSHNQNVEVIDLPPNYDSAVRIHTPAADTKSGNNPDMVTSTTTTTTTTNKSGFTTKTKQMWGKYVYKPNNN